MIFRDRAGAEWRVSELSHERFVFGALVFENPQESCVAWGSPILWRQQENLAALFDLAVPL